MTNTNYPSATTPVTPQTPKGRGSKNIVIGILAAGLLGTWGYLLYDKNKAGEKMTQQQTQINTLDSAKTSIQLEFEMPWPVWTP